MANQAKKKVGGSRNDNRNNGKAAKGIDAPRNRKNPQSELQKVLLGKGMMSHRVEIKPTPNRRSSDG